MIIDVHGHYTTAPAALGAWRDLPDRRTERSLPDTPSPSRTEDQRRRAARIDRDQPAEEDGRARQRPHRLQPARELHGASHRRLRDVGDLGRDLQRALLSRRADVPRPLRRRGDAAAVARASIRRPASPSWSAASSEYGFVGINLNPDPSGGHWTSPPLTDRHWYRSTRRWSSTTIPAMIHVTTSCNPCFHTTGAHYLNADTTAFMQCLDGRPVQGLPDA